MQKPNEQLDAIFKSLNILNFEAKDYLLSGRQYTGNFSGRPIYIYQRSSKASGGSNNLGNSKYLGHNIEIFVDSPLKTRAFLTQTGSMSGFLNRKIPPVVVSEFKDNDLNYQATDSVWATALATNAKEPMLRLSKQDKYFGMRSLSVYPETVCMHVRCDYRLLTVELLTSWLEDLSSFVTIAESIPPPSQLLQETKNEENMRGMARESAAKGSKQVFIGIGVVLALIIYSLFRMI